MRRRVPFRRARTSGDKALRQSTILAAARRVFAVRGWEGFGMSEVAARAGVVKGTLYLYWPTKEHLLLELLEELLDGLLTDFDARLDALDVGRPPERLVDLLCRVLRRHAPVEHLLALFQTVLRRSVTRRSADRFKQRLLIRLATTGARLERHIPGLQAGEGLRVILHANALLIGLVQMADPSGARHSGPQALRIDFQRELRAGLATYVRGVLAGL